MRYANLALIAISVLGYFSLYGSMAWTPFLLATMLPWVVVAYLAIRWHSLGSQLTSLMATISYSAWLIYVYVSAVLDPDPQSPIALVLVAIPALPCLLFFWLIAYAFEWNERTKPTHY